MADKQTYWLTSDGVFALATGVAERDRWIPLGWALAEDGPGDTDRVWAWHDGIEQPAALTAFAKVWEPREWKPGPPPGGDHPFAQAAAPVGAGDETSAASVAAAKSTTNAAAGGKSKE